MFGALPASLALLITFSGVWQACGTNEGTPYLPVADTGTTPACPAVPCADGLECVGGECIVLDGCLDPDNDGFGPGCGGDEDCDPDDATVFPGAAELCDEVDNDCDFILDEGGVCVPCEDRCEPGTAACAGDRISRCDDSSGCANWADPTVCPAGLSCANGACVETCIDADNDGFPIDCPGQREDCDDANASRFPRNSEICDGIDNDCDDDVDERGVCDGPCEDLCTIGDLTCTPDATAYVACIRGADGCARFDAPRICGSTRTCVSGTCVDNVECVDVDADGAGPNCPVADCRPLDPTAYTGANETCDGVDEDCDGVVDDGGVCDACSAAPANAPLALTAGGTLERVSCGGFEHVDVSSVAGATRAVTVMGDGPVTIDMGTVSGGTFSGSPGTTIGGAAAIVGTGPVVRVNAPAGTRYVLAAAPPLGTCTPDGFEPNNAPLAGSPVGVPPFAGAPRVCPNDLDFFQVDVLPGQVISVAAGFEPQVGGDVLPQIWRNGVAVSSPDAGDFVGGFAMGRSTHFRADLPGQYAVGVRGVGPGSEASVALVARASTVSCADDAGETTEGLDDDTLATARPFAGTRSVSGTLCPGDYDVLEVGSLADGATYSADFTASNAAIGFLVVRGVLGSVFHDGFTDDTETSFSSNVSTAGNYFVVIYSRDPTATGTYTYSQTTR